MKYLEGLLLNPLNFINAHFLGNPNSFFARLPYRIRAALIACVLTRHRSKLELENFNYRGVIIPLDLPVLTDAILSSIFLGTYEDQEIDLVDDAIRDGDRVLEIGVGLGILTTRLLQQFKLEAYLGYEANPELKNLIERIFRLNNIDPQVRNRALARMPNTNHIIFYVRHHFWASSMSPKPWGFKRKVSVQIDDFDVVLGEFQPTVLIIDIEGGEHDLLINADLKGVDRIILEVHPKVTGEARVQSLLGYLCIQGFTADAMVDCKDVFFLTRSTSCR